MKKKQLRKHFVKYEVKESVKQRPLAYHNLPRRTKLANCRYVDDCLNRPCKSESYLKIKKK